MPNNSLNEMCHLPFWFPDANGDPVSGLSDVRATIWRDGAPNVLIAENVLLSEVTVTLGGGGTLATGLYRYSLAGQSVAGDYTGRATTASASAKSKVSFSQRYIGQGVEAVYTVPPTAAMVAEATRASIERIGGPLLSLQGTAALEATLSTGIASIRQDLAAQPAPANATIASIYADTQALLADIAAQDSVLATLETDASAASRAAAILEAIAAFETATGEDLAGISDGLHDVLADTQDLLADLMSVQSALDAIQTAVSGLPAAVVAQLERSDGMLADIEAQVGNLPGCDEMVQRLVAALGARSVQINATIDHAGKWELVPGDTYGGPAGRPAVGFRWERQDLRGGTLSVQVGSATLTTTDASYDGTDTWFYLPLTAAQTAALAVREPRWVATVRGDGYSMTTEGEFSAADFAAVPPVPATA